jgi:hypothetical membrane protein
MELNRTRPRDEMPAREALRRLTWLALGGVIGPAILVFAFTFAGMLRPGYSPIHRAVSDLGVGSNAWLLDGAGVLTALFLTAFVIAFNRLMRRSMKSSWLWLCTVLLELLPVGLAISSIFTAAPGTLAIHWMVGATLSFLGPVLGCAAVGSALYKSRSWRPFAIYSFASSVGALLLVIVMDWVWTPGTPLRQYGLGGLFERLVLIEALAWYVVAGWLQFRRAVAADA